VILLLSNLGIKDDVFLRYQGDMLSSVNAMMWDPELAVKFCGVCFTVKKKIHSGYLDKGVLM
jgi:hypothetical protein